MAIASFSEDPARWRERFAAGPERDATFSTLSGVGALQDVRGRYAEVAVF
jgi:hypothetical protein